MLIWQTIEQWLVHYHGAMLQLCEERHEHAQKQLKVEYLMQRELLIRYLFNLIASNKGKLRFGN
jgi:hypothetical protein